MSFANGVCVQDESVQEGSLAPVSADLMPERRRDKIARYAKHGARLTAIGAQRVVSRTLWWGGWGIALGAVTFAVVWGLGLLALPWPQAEIPVWVVVGILYLVAGAGCWGQAGMWRGFGRFAIAIGVGEGFVVSMLDVVLTRVMAFFRKSQRVGAALDKSEEWVGDLPLERWEIALKSVSAKVIGEDDPNSGRVAGWLRSFVVRRIERYLLAIVRKESHANGGGGVSMERVREVGFDQAERWFTESVKGVMNKQLLLMTALFFGLSCLPPLLAWAARYWG